MVTTQAPLTPVTPIVQASPAGEEAEAVALQQRYAATAPLLEDQRRRVLKALAEAEHRLPPLQLRAVTLARMQAFLRMDEQMTAADVERIVASLEAVMDELPGDLAMRRVEFVQTIVHQFSPGDQQRLKRLIPGVLEVRSANHDRVAAVASKPRRRWQFWRKA